MIILIATVVFILYFLLNQYFIVRKDKHGELMIQILSFLAAGFFLIFGAWLYFAEPILMWDGLILILMGFLLLIGHINSAKHGYKGW